MLITFKCSADADVIMFGEVGATMLAVLGKDPHDPQGIVTVEQLPAALTALDEAIERDRYEARAAMPEPGDEDEDQPAPPPAIRFAQRAVPLQALLQRAKAEGVPVLWQASGSAAHS